MDTGTLVDVLARQEFAEATVIRIQARAILEGEQFVAVREALYREAELGDRPLILDLAAVEHLGSAALGWLVTLRKKLMQRGRPFRPPCQRRGLFAFFGDQAEALEAVRRGEPDPLLLCGVRPQVREIFAVC